MRNDRRKRDGCMLCTPLDQRGEQQLLKDEMIYIQPKLDGERCIAEYYKGKCELRSSTRKPILTMPHIAEAIEKLFGPNDHVTFDGELYIHGVTRQKLRSYIGTQDGHLNANDVQYWIFDLVDEHLAQNERLKLLAMTPERGPLRRCPTLVATSTRMAPMEWAHGFASEGFEGAIFRRTAGMYVTKRSRDIFKLKVMDKTWCSIVGWKEEVSKDGEPKGTLGALQCITPDGVTFHVGTGPILTKENRLRLWDKAASLMGRACLVKHQFRSEDGVPLCPSLYEIEE